MDARTGAHATDPAAQDLAQRAGDYMYAHDAASRGLGMALAAIGPGTATMTMRVRPDMLNGHGTCQGGFIFALADSTFAFACNSRNQVTVAAGCTIEFMQPGRRDDLLTARATERALAGRRGVYDVTVTNAAGDTIAVFQGKSHSIRGTVLPAE